MNILLLCFMRSAPILLFIRLHKSWSKLNYLSDFVKYFNVKVPAWAWPFQLLPRQDHPNLCQHQQIPATLAFWPAFAFAFVSLLVTIAETPRRLRANSWWLSFTLFKGQFGLASWKCSEESFAHQVKIRDPLKIGCRFFSGPHFFII
jgi:hypothetical protein